MRDSIIGYQELVHAIEAVLIGVPFVSLIVHVVMWKFSRSKQVPLPDEQGRTVIVQERHSAAVFANFFFMVIGILMFFRSSSVVEIIISVLRH